VKFEALKTTLDYGDTLLIYTDGVTDAVNSSQMEFTTERLLGLVQTFRSSARELLEAIHSELHAHITDAPQADDITLLAARRL
jgi:sigma-B regulation protein RsbU (phosphoserine phosphatase)